MARFPSRDQVLRLSDTPGGSLVGPELPGPAVFDADALSVEVDDRCRRYISEVREDFQDLRHALAQSAGLLLLEQIGGAAANLPDHPMLVAVRKEIARVGDNLRSVHPPPTARHHHLHLLRAADLIGSVVERVTLTLRRDGAAAVTALAADLRAGWDELRHAENALPGFETMNFGQSCCAMHAAMVRTCAAVRNE